MTDEKLVEVIESALVTLSYEHSPDLVNPLFRDKAAKVIATAISRAENDRVFGTDYEIERFVEAGLEELDLLTEADIIEIAE